YVSLAELYIDNQYTTRAKEILDYLSTLGLSNDDQLGDIYSFYGEVFTNMRDYEKAIASHQRSLDHYKSVYGEKHDWVASVYGNIGDTYRQMSIYDSAIHYYHRALIALSVGLSEKSIFALPTYEQISNPGGSIDILRHKAETLEDWYMASDDPTYLREAYNTYAQAIQFVDEEWNNYQRNDVLLFYGDKMTKIYKAAIANAFHLYEITSDHHYVVQAFNYSEKRKSWLLLKSLNNAESLASDLVPQEVLSAELALSNDIIELEGLIRRSLQIDQEPTMADSLKNLVFSKKLIFEQLQDSLKTIYPSYYEVKYQKIDVSVTALQNELLTSESDRLIAYEVLNDTLIYAFVLDQSSIKMHEITGLNIGEVAKQLQQALHSNESKDLWALSELVYSKLIASLQIDDAPGSLLIIPVGLMSYIPFEMLGPSQEQMLINDYSIRYGYSATLASRFSKREKPSISNVLAVIPDKNEELPYARSEGKEIINLLDGDLREGIVELTDNDGPDDQYDILHFATHGVIDNEDPMYSYLSIGGDTSDVLYAYQLYNLTLNSALVTLSACNTAIGKLVQGEGLMSLAHAFSYAGSPNVVATLWSVEDRSSYEIMTAFYRNLKAGQRKDHALRNAKLEYLSNADDYGRHPYYWSGIVLIGDDQALDFQSSRRLFIAAGGLLLLLVLFYRFKSKLLKQL
ncbi:MAG: CHAT domain-containing tetratricopeptide repeat protein, partial [Bacteroidota bacterium]